MHVRLWMMQTLKKTLSEYELLFPNEKDSDVELFIMSCEIVCSFFIIIDTLA